MLPRSTQFPAAGWAIADLPEECGGRFKFRIGKPRLENDQRPSLRVASAGRELLRSGLVQLPVIGWYQAFRELGKSRCCDIPQSLPEPETKATPVRRALAF
jgi:hypothetical protein